MTILSEAFINREPFEDVKHVKPSNLGLRDVSKFGDNKKSIIQREKEKVNLSTCTPLPPCPSNSRQYHCVCACRPSARGSRT